MSSPLNPDALEDIKDLMGDNFPALVEKYLRNSANTLENAKQALAEGNARALADNAHSLKSPSASLGAMQLSDLAEAIEKGASEADENGQDMPEDLANAFAKLEELFKAVEAALKEETGM